MIPLFIAFIIALGASGTVVASDSARPGDLLFPIDRVVEEVRAAFASTEGEVELKVKFAEERLDEMDSILEDESATSTSNGVSGEAMLNLSHALDILTMHLADIHNAASTTPPGILQALAVIESRLQSRVSSLPQELKIKIRDDRGRIELKTEEGKVKVKIDSDGEIEVEVENEGDDSSGSSSNSGSGSSNSGKNDDDDGKDDDSSSAFEAEADVFTDTTIVEVEINDQKSTFTTSAKTRAAVVAEIVSRHPTLVAADVDAALDFEIENRASRPGDMEEDSDDSSGSSDDDDDSSDSSNSGNSDDDDDNEDDSNSGSSGGNSGSGSSDND